MLVVIVETEEAANVRGIMAVPGVDVALIGPGDLMVDAKARGHEDHEAFEVAAAAPERGVAAGYAGPTAEIAARRVAQAFGCMQDASITSSCSAALARSANRPGAWPCADRQASGMPQRPTTRPSRRRGHDSRKARRRLSKTGCSR
jgi:hypothetical protein